jgi:hypothetical protein
MRKVTIHLLWVLLISLVGCGPSVRIFSDLDQAEDFDRYTTYTFMDFTDGNKKTIPGMELERIRVAVARELEKRGLQFVEKNGDVSVKITVYHREAINGHWSYPWVYNYMERAIAVDMYDNQSMKHIWHSAAVGELEYDPEERAEKLPQVTARLFKRYPVQPAEEI